MKASDFGFGFFEFKAVGPVLTVLIFTFLIIN
jgi:hypothetical protein